MKPSQAAFSAARKTGAAAMAAAGGTGGLKAAGIAAVKHSAGKHIATRFGLYLAGTLGIPGAAVAVTPLVAIGLTVATVALVAGGIAAKAKGM